MPALEVGFLVGESPTHQRKHTPSLTMHKGFFPPLKKRDYIILYNKKNYNNKMHLLWNQDLKLNWHVAL